MLTKLDIAAIRQADDICVHLSHPHHAQGLIRLIKRKVVSDAQPFAQDIEHVLTASASLYGFHGRGEMESGAAKFFAMRGIHHSLKTPLSCALKTLRAGDECEFQFWPDAASNGYLAMYGLHGDTLHLIVRRNGKTVATWHIETSVCPSNSARMCQGVPNTDSYERQAEEARKVA